MSKIEELISELCPKGINSPPLSELLLLQRGERVTKSDLLPDGQIPVVSGGKGYMGFVRDSNREMNTITIAQYGAAGYVAWQNQAFWANDVCFSAVLKTDLLQYRFLYHFLKSRQEFIFSISNRVAVPYSIDSKRLLSMTIPLPPLEVQREIVSILDKFTQLEAELEAELEARKYQLEYYRQNLLTFDVSEVPNSFLGDIYDFQYGKGNTIPTKGGKYPVYGSNGAVGSHNEFNSEDAPVIGHIGAYAGVVNWADGEHFVTYNGVICKIKAGFDPRFGYHLLMKQNLRELANEGSQPFVSYDKLKSVVVQLPTINKQKELAVLLDSLEALTSDISMGLPAEIAARRKQYEYYRNELLTFKELETA